MAVKYVDEFRDGAVAQGLAHAIAAEVRADRRRPRDFAIFYRTNALSRQFEHALREHVIPYQIVNGGTEIDVVSGQEADAGGALAAEGLPSGGHVGYEIFDKSMNAPAQERMDLELDLRNAVARGEFILHYQPILELSTGRIVEMEALVRWKHPLPWYAPQEKSRGIDLGAALKRQKPGFP